MTGKESIDNKLVIKIGAKLGSGSFGEIRLAKYGDRNELMAIKLERKDSKSPTLHFEYSYYRLLGTVDGVPKIYYFGSCGKYNALVMQRLGNSLESCFKAAGSRFTVKTTIQLGLQMLQRIEYVHSKGIVYRDVKPENFLFGTGETASDTKKLYIIDFGLAKHYKDPVTNQHIPFRTGKTMTGTARYMSTNTHLGYEQSRRDDVEAIGHVLIYFLRGSLPWQSLTCEPGERSRRIGEVKQSTSVGYLCQDIPEEFASFLKHCRKLDFKEAPDYKYLKKLLTSLFKKNEFKEDNVFDWEKKTEKVWPPSMRTESQMVGSRSTTKIEDLKKAKTLKTGGKRSSRDSVKKTSGSNKK